MSDIEDELLALAGGDSEDEGSVRSRGGSESPRRSRNDAGKSKKSKRRARQDDSEEEGEASSAPSSPNSLESAPMDESDSDAEPAPRGGGTDEDDKYPVDGKFTSEAERAEIMAMREVDRERILAERMDEVERQRQRRRLRQMIEETERRNLKKKRSADTAELEDGQRKASRQRTGKGNESAMDSLRRARAEKAKRKEDKTRGRDYSPVRRDSDEEESGDDFSRARSRTPEKEQEKEAPPAELKDFERVRLGRNEFAQVCFTPGFESAITGCYIRIALGPHPETGVEQYRMAVIKGFTTSRPYALTGPQGPFVTDQYVKAAHGKAVKEFPFIAASSGKFTDNELNRYQVTCANENVKLPTKSYLADKIDEINNLINHKWTSEEIKARLAKRNELKRRFDPTERERVGKLLDEAVARGDETKAQELQEELEQLGTQRLAFRTTLGSSRDMDGPRAATEQDRLAERNRENRRMNAELVRKAQLKEKARAREIEMALKRGEQVADDPSRRLRTKAKFVHDVNDTPQKLSANGSEASTPANGTPKVAATKPEMLSHLAKLQEKNYSESNGVPGIHKPLMDDDLIGALDLDIDVEI
ncbi:RNA polymerase II transcription elongation factor Rtf1p, putative [Metarhizium acridum CQMa 102]|uniref:RNA polymerase II transcription elongation factor Rtf1p, putative n=1 Tax=Metarhizium acridum (strain CQMa 102) TaxID=655827 RepID=E9DU55_METAQ|nr:RNA polymerase II transcription elongation factor Rtf1p, putative [Metarhizium acridum CQMa 102]EFY92915.1 RNA polymerase II transcription elongation factor Rtf1p, putative [Metarhizium acridum CQMa 102]